MEDRKELKTLNSIRFILSQVQLVCQVVWQQLGVCRHQMRKR